MTNISKVHKRFSECISEPRVLESPEEFLGPNFKAVLNFWKILDDLTKDQLKTIKGRYSDFYNNQWPEWDKATNEAIKASEETIGGDFAGNAGWAAWVVYDSSVSWTTRELIGMHKFFEQNKPLFFIPLTFNF